MIRDAQRLAAAAGGRLLSADRSAVARGQVCVDTRLLMAGDVFLALPGRHTDGHHFIAEALRRGADGIIARGGQGRERKARIEIEVDNPPAALRSLARARRRELRGHAIAVTGAVGKTTTVDILAALLAASHRVHATRDGFNTHHGVAATIASAPEETEALVVELSMQARGHISDKAALLEPTAALLTNIAPVHLETVGTTFDVAHNKAELIASLPPGAACVVPSDEPLLEPHLRSDLATIRHGPGGDVQLRAFVDGVATISCGGSSVEIRPGFSQRHNLSNLVAAVAVLHALGITPPPELELELSPLRWERARLGELELVLDCVNSNPRALGAALSAFAEEPAGRRLAVLGDFAELGEAALRYHREAGEQAERFGIDVLIVVGRPARQYLAGYRGEAYAVETPNQARRLLQAIGNPGDRVLVKGSRHCELERIVRE